MGVVEDLGEVAELETAELFTQLGISPCNAWPCQSNILLLLRAKKSLNKLLLLTAVRQRTKEHGEAGKTDRVRLRS